MKDRTGRDIHEGAVVDLLLNGMYSGVVSTVIEPSRIAGAPPQPPCIILQVVLTLPSHDGRHVDAYMVKDADSFMPKMLTQGVM